MLWMRSRRWPEDIARAIRNNAFVNSIDIELFVYFLLFNNIPWARMDSESIGHERERNNLFSKIQLVGQKYQEKTTLAS